jgi:phage/plasmid-associated DNA primase
MWGIINLLITYILGTAGSIVMTSKLPDPEVVINSVDARFGPDAIEDRARPFLIIGSRGGRKIDASLVADVIRRGRSVVSFEKRLWYYDTKYNCYRRGDSDGTLYDDIAFIYNLCDGIHTSQNIRNFSDDVMYYLMKTNSCNEYPFGVSLGSIPVMNGIVQIDFNTGEVELKPYDRSVMSLWRLPVYYDKDASGDGILDILSKCVKSDDVGALYQIPAHAIMENWCVLSSDGRFRSAFSPSRQFYVLTGPPRSGKTSYQEILQRFFGLGAYASVGLDKMTDKFGISALEGKLINIHDELKHFDFNDASRVKALTGGHHHEIEEKYKNPIVARITTVHLFATNSTPIISDYVYNDTAFWERVYMLNFTGKFDTNPNFVNMLTDEAMSGFLNNIIEMLVMIIQERKLHYTNDTKQKADEARAGWCKAMSNISQFVVDNLIHYDSYPAAIISYADFFRKYSDWCYEKGYIPHEDANFIIKSVERIGIKTSRGSDQRRHFLDVQFRDPQRKVEEK